MDMIKGDDAFVEGVISLYNYFIRINFIVWIKVSEPDGELSD